MCMDTLLRTTAATRCAATPFDCVRASAPQDVRERVRAFAVEVAKRHRRGPGDLRAMIVALRGWYHAWALCAPSRVPQLDDDIVALAIASYERASLRYPSKAA
jgi:hypothetical protein